MLDAYVIEEIKRRERDRAGDERRPVVELPIPAAPEEGPGRRPEDDGAGDRGVVIIDYAS